MGKIFIPGSTSKKDIYYSTPEYAVNAPVKWLIANYIKGGRCLITINTNADITSIDSIQMFHAASGEWLECTLSIIIRSFGNILLSVDPPSTDDNYFQYGNCYLARVIGIHTS